jgi:hypothetical protein
MTSSLQLPLVFLACVNSYQNKRRRLRHLVQERKQIASLLVGSGEQPFYQPVQKGNLPHDRFFQLLKLREYSERVAILHLAGPADGSRFRIESDEFETEVSLSELANLAGSMRGLQAVFLSGCASPEAVEALIRRDIPAVIATQTQDRDPRAYEIARSFYYYLAQGCTVIEAFHFTSVRFQELRTVEIRYEIETDEWLWDRKSDEPMPWGLYYLPENLERINRRLSRPSPAIHNEFRKPSLRRTLRVAAAALLLALSGALLALMLYPPQALRYLVSF